MSHLVAIWLWFGRRPAPVFNLFAVTVSLLVACLVWIFGAERRFVLLKNLALCFPEKSLWWRYRTGFAHMVLYVRTFLDRAWLWQQPAHVIEQRVTLSGLENLRQAQAPREGSSDITPVIILAPHFLGLDAGWTRLSLAVQMVTMYSNQKNPILNALLRQGRARFGEPVLLSRQEGVRGILKNLKQGRPLYYLPDMDFGERDAVFVPFFGIKAATVTAVARLARMTGARVMFCPTRWERRGLLGAHYTLDMLPHLSDFPPDGDEAATARVNTEIEGLIRGREAQYLWTHKRFKTRPSGESGFYGRYHR